MRFATPLSLGNLVCAPLLLFHTAAESKSLKEVGDSGHLAIPATSPAAAPPMTLRSIQSGGMTRYYRVHEPIGYDPQVSTSLVMAFHGGGGNAVQFADQSEMYVTADDLPADHQERNCQNDQGIIAGWRWL